jgi:capsule polysaccharide modification protein KpsS
LYKNKFTKFDPDTPKFISKYLSLISVSSRHKIYPKGHELFFDNSNDGEVFFLYPLHYEWEAQIASREPFLNQIDLARQIASILPHNTYLYVKVHPHWKNADQDLLKIYNLKKDKNIRLIKPEENTIELIKKSLGLIVINSTTGYEAIALEKPIIVIGHEAYKEIGINIKDMNELPLALMGIKNKTHKINKKTYAEFLMKYMNHVIDSSDPNVIAHEIKQLISWLSKA